MDYASLTTPLSTGLSPLINTTIKFLQENFIPRLIELFTAPVSKPGMMWIVTPLITSMVLMQLYFGRHREEELGWNTAFGNSIALIFVSLNLLQVLYNAYGMEIINLVNPPDTKIYLIIGLLTISLAQLVINFFHLVPKRIAFFLNSAVIINFIAYISIILIYTTIPLDLVTTLVSLIGLFIAIVAFESAKRIVPMTREAKEFVEVEEHKFEMQRTDEEVEDLMQEKVEETIAKDGLIAFAIAGALIGGRLIIEYFIKDFLNYYLIVIGAGLLVTAFYLIRKRGLSVENFNYDAKKSNVITGIIIGLGLMVTYTSLNMLISETMGVSTTIDAQKDLINIIITLVSSLIIIPLGIEFIFRGIIQRSLKDKLTNNGAVIIQGVMHSIMILNLGLITGAYGLAALIALPISMIIGILLGVSRERYGFESCVTAHITANALGFFLWLMPATIF